ncbi:MAG TPA: DegT/DnrJ/EryC1/StrS family aminotransferase [Bacteroidia bacterium]|nr:DegT/DnrJ/EryC1/StrS family aminotransferase [Bacteroidia bacterium]
MINVSKPFLPPSEEFQRYVDDIWKRNWLTNDGPLLNELELKLKEYLGVNHFLFVNNGTIALQIAIKALKLSGEIITTPFSFVATTSSIAWENCSPVFVDIDRSTYNIDPTKIEAAITEKTSGILATHVYGNPCDIDAIDRIAKKHNLKVIYDAAHCFGTKYKGKSAFAYGDISITSFHATKLFHTVEGGGVFPNTPELTYRSAKMRNFGFASYESFDGIGINGKNCEFHSAMGLCNLRHVDEILRLRKTVSQWYDDALQGLNVERPALQEHSEYNYAYYPIIFPSEEVMLKSKQVLEVNRISTRRYFYPTLSGLEYVKPHATPVADDIAKRVLCLPLYHDLSSEEVLMISRILLRTQNYGA